MIIGWAQLNNEPNAWEGTRCEKHVGVDLEVWIKHLPA